MNNFQKKDLKLIWNNLFNDIKNKYAITETYFFAQYDRDSYIALNFNDIQVFFIFKMEEERVELFSYNTLSIDIIEIASVIKNRLENTIFKNKSVKTKARKSD